MAKSKFSNAIKRAATPEVLTLAAVFVGGFVVWKYVLSPILESAGLKETKEEKEAAKQQAKDFEAYQKQEEAKAKPTRTAAEWGIIADAIDQQLNKTAVSDDKAGALKNLMLVQNTTDWVLLVEKFGKRQQWFGFLPDGAEVNLPKFVTDNFSKSDIEKLNADYRKKGVRWQF